MMNIPKIQLLAVRATPNLLKTGGQVQCLKRFTCPLVFPSCSLVRFHSLECLQHYVFGDFIWLCFVHWFLPYRLTIVQNWITQPLRSTSVTKLPHYYRPFRPPLHPASVLSYLWVFHLEFSLGIGSRFPRS